MLNLFCILFKYSFSLKYLTNKEKDVPMEVDQKQQQDALQQQFHDQEEGVTEEQQYEGTQQQVIV